MEKNKNITIVGLGYVGLPLALLAEKKGFEVAGVVRTSKTRDLINSKKSPFKDALIQKDLKKSGIRASTSFKEIRNSQVVVICVPTPATSTNKPDLAPLKDVTRKIAEHLQSGQLIILESTVNPGVSEEIMIPLIDKISGLHCGKDYSFAHCPERINPGDEKWTVERIPRVIGAFDKNSLARGKKFYETVISGKVAAVKSLKEAEAVKIVENAFRDINIAFVNELALSFDNLGIDVVDVINAAATKPFSFMAHYPGAGVGGHCIPVDPYYLIDYARKKGFKHDFLMLARRINNSMPNHTVDLLVEGLKKMKINTKNAKVVVLGLAYKPGIDDTRESPAMKIIEELKIRGIYTRAFDPYVAELSSFDSIDRALASSNAAIIATNHKEFISLPFKKWLSLKVVIDGRNCLDKARFTGTSTYYKGIGR